MIRLVIPMCHKKKHYPKSNQAHNNHDHSYHHKHMMKEMEGSEAPMTGMRRVAQEVMDIAENPPETWSEYKDQPGEAWDIIQMEFIEAQNAWQRMKTSTGTHSKAIKEFHHLAAAVMCAIEKMTCDD